jgi:tetratricopeptide (TPR) repeat protein
MAETEFKYDVFISYSHKDEKWVVDILLSALESTGLKVCIDFRDFKPGKPSRHNMRDACKESAFTVLVMTPAWMASEWTEFEGLLTFLHDPSGKRQRTVPILLEKCEIPEDIQIFTYVDFTRKDREAIAWKQLFTALGKPEALAPATSAPDTRSRDTWHLAHPYPMPPNFTGRATELKMLDDWLADDKDRLFILRALGGFGKSALAWQWINTHVDPAEWTRLIWWSFYEGDASFEHFIEETLKYLKLEVPQGQRPQVDELLKAMQAQKILLIMDGFERALRAYSSMNAAYQGDSELPSPLGGGAGGGVESSADCVNINAEIFLKSVCSLPNIKSKVLMTTRLTPRAVKPRGEFMLGCREEELTAMQKEDAILFFHKQKIKGTHAEIEAACAPYGYHPLSLRLLAGRILKDFENPADIVVAQRLKIDGDLKAHQHHVLEVSYNSVPPHEQKLLSTIACFRSPVELKTLQSIAENKDTLDADLHDLVDRGLLHHTTRLVSNHPVSIFDLHPIVRRYAYDRLTAPDRTAAHTRLRDYFAAIDVPEQVKTLDDLAPIIELYHHTIRAGEFDKAFDLYYHHITHTAYYQFGAYELCIECLQALFPNGRENLPRLTKEDHQAWVLNSLANSFGISGQPSRAMSLFEQHNRLREKNDNKLELARGLRNIAYGIQLHIGDLHAAESNLQNAIDLSQEIQDKFGEAIARCELGRVFSYRGVWEGIEQELNVSLKMAENQGLTQFYSSAWLYLALRAMLMVRDPDYSSIENHKLAISHAQHALNMAQEHARTSHHSNERDFVRAYWLVGASLRANDQYDLAEQNLSEALVRCRAINLVEVEADILLDLARLRYDQKKTEEAKSLADEALSITERCGYVLQGADVNLFLAQYALEQEKDKVKAKGYAETALKLAYCDGPPYYYKVAYEEAERMLDKLNKMK